MMAKAELAMVWRLFVYDAARQRKRIALTVLAIAWGTLSIILMLSFGEGMKRSFHKGSRGLGEGIAVVWPGATTRAYLGLPSGRNIRFTTDDVAILRARVPEIGAISGEYARGLPLTVGTKTVNARVRGVEPPFGEMRNLIPQAGGRFLNDLDLRDKRRAIFLGDELAKNLFGTQNPVGRMVLVNQSPFTVVGVMQPKIMMGMYSGPDKTQGTSALPARGSRR